MVSAHFFFLTLYMFPDSHLDNKGCSLYQSAARTEAHTLSCVLGCC